MTHTAQSRAAEESPKMVDISKIGDLLATEKSLAIQAYQRGYKDGVASARSRIVSSLSNLGDEGDNNITETPVAPPPATTSPKNGVARSPHGAVRPIVMRILSSHPGSTITEAQRIAEQMGSSVSALSIGGEIRRLNGRFYHKDGQRWYLTEDGKKEAVGLAQEAWPSASHGHNQGGSDDTALATSVSE
jgi:hypothetical protein